VSFSFGLFFALFFPFLFVVGNCYLRFLGTSRVRGDTPSLGLGSQVDSEWILYSLIILCIPITCPRFNVCGEKDMCLTR
jgi:hypothetical protein